MKKILLFTITLWLFTCAAFASNKTVEVFGESQIINNDLVSAKIQAEARAKWNAMEEAAQVDLSVVSVVHNAQILDEAIKSSVKGSIKSFTILDEGRDGDVYWLQAKVVVEPGSALKAMDEFSNNSSIAVIVPMVHSNNLVEETHPFSEQLMNELIELGFTVVDVALEAPEISDAITNAVKRNDMTKVRDLASRLMTGSILVGTLKVVDKGSDIGYGDAGFNIVDGTFEYRIITNKKGSKSIIYSSSIQGRGQGVNISSAALNLSRSMAKKDAVTVAGVTAEKVQGANSKTIKVMLSGNTDIKRLQELKEDIQNISWVLDVKERGTDTLIVNYPDKVYYLATMINSNTGLTVKSFTETEIILSGR